MVSAGIVLYNPKIERMKENIGSVLDQVDKLIIVDNGSSNIKEIKNNISDTRKIHLIENVNNLGIAAALNQIVVYSDQNGYEWTLMLDQDSVCKAGLVKEYLRYVHVDKVAMMTCEIIDRNIDRSFLVGVKEEAYTDYCVVERCITSGSFLNVRACLDAGLFDETMFIDYVDYDMCFSLNEHGYKIIKCKYIGIIHELGETQVRKVLGLEFIVTNHSPLRRYYFSRNIIYCIRKHKHSISTAKYMYKNVVRIIIVFLYEDQKLLKLKSAFRGMKDGFKMEIKR